MDTAVKQQYDSDAVVWPIKLELNKESVMYIKKRITFFKDIWQMLPRDSDCGVHVPIENYLKYF